MVRGTVLRMQVPGLIGVTPILHKSRLDSRLRAKRLELVEPDVANSKKTRLTAFLNRFHGAPCFPVCGSQRLPKSRPVQHEGIDVRHAEMFERAGE